MSRSKLAFAVALVAALPLAQARAEDFKIGTILPLTGPGADIGRFLVEGAKATVAMVNQDGGIGGMHVELIVCDTQTVEQQAVLCARRLTGDQKVNLLLGAGTTPQTMAILPSVENAQVPLFAIAGGVVTYRPFKKWVFKALATNEDQIPAAVDYLKRKGITKIADIHDNGPFGTDVAATLKPIAAKAGLTIIADEVYTATDQDMSAQATRVRATKPEAIFDMSSNPPPGAIVAKKILQLGITVPIVVGVNLQTKAFADMSGEATEQMIFIGNKASVESVADNDPLAPNIKAFRAAFKATHPDETVVGLSTTCADSILLAQAAAKSLGARALDGNALRQALESLHDVPGIQGIWSFSPTSHESSMKDGIALLKYVKGKWELVP
jgi:branched-chain amino acid transport system substrate-binding protein